MGRILTILGIVIVGALIVFTLRGDNPTSITGDEVIVYKSPTCGCCVSYIAYLKDNGFKVRTEEVSDMNSIKTQNGVPLKLQSCHTAIFGDYVVEGHVPLEVVNKLLSEKPDIDGIALPGMPAGSPGMPGVKSEDFVIYSIKDGSYQEYMKI